MSRLYWTSPAARDALYADATPAGQVSELQLAAFVELNPPGSGAPHPGELDEVSFDIFVLCQGDPGRLGWLVGRRVIEVADGRFRMVEPETFRRRWWPTITEQLADAVAGRNDADGVAIIETLQREGWTWADLARVTHGPDANRTAAQNWYRRARAKMARG